MLRAYVLLLHRLIDKNQIQPPICAGLPTKPTQERHLYPLASI